MSENKHTPGPWFVTGKLTKYVEARIGGGLVQEVAACGPTAADNGYGDQQEANAHLIAAAPDLLEALDKMLDNEEQRDFEKWLRSKAPSGDCSDVQAQWLESSDYEDFLENWKLQIAAIAKARGDHT